MEYIIYQVDAFTNQVFGGNPAAVIPNAHGLDNRRMQQIAREMNCSETVFVFPLDKVNNEFEVRFFTPTQEVDLCGHGTIGAFEVLWKKGYIKKKGNLVKAYQKTKAGRLEVLIEESKSKELKIMMEQPSPQRFLKKTEINIISNILTLSEEDIGIIGKSVKPEVISTGLKDLIVPVKSLDLLKKIKVDIGKLKEYSKQMDIIGIHVFTLETLDKRATAHCRNFAPIVGIEEEAATGTSSGALAFYLYDHHLMDKTTAGSLIFEQGYFIDRPSRIFASIRKDGAAYNVYVGGQAVICLEGVLNL